MAIFHLDIQPIARARGRTATAAAAYRAGERIRDERTGALYDHTQREDVLHKEIFLPSRLDNPEVDMRWARDRARLWNAAEKAEQQSNSRVAREYQLALPAELNAEQRVALARTFSREIADRYDVAVDLSVHAPRPEGDPRNFHAHLLATTRQVGPEGLGPKTGLDMEGGIRSELGLPPSRQEFGTLRARWAQLANQALKEANLEARIDHRSLAAQGIDREPRPHLPIAAIATERRGERSEVAERIRAQYRARVAAREARAARQASAGEVPAGPQTAAQSARRDVAPNLVAANDMEARRKQAVQDWLAYRKGLTRDRHEPAGETSTRQPPSMEEIRQQAVMAWRSLRARGAESPPSVADRRSREAGPERERAGPAGETPGLGEDLSG